jgi:hypothetical protein
MPLLALVNIKFSKPIFRSLVDFRAMEDNKDIQLELETNQIGT